MSDRFRLTLAQLNATVGDLKGNAALAFAAWEQAKAADADLLALPEMFITGYNPQDLVLKPAFHQAAIAAIQVLARECAAGPAIAIGGPALDEGKLYNAYYVLQGGEVTACVRKHHLPNASVFDEKRLYEPAPISGPFTVRGLRIGSPICEDGWHEDVAETMAETGAELLLVPNGSPYCRDKLGLRQTVMVSRVIETGLPLVYLNLVGGQDDLVFDGGSFVLNPGGALMLQMPVFETGLTHVDFSRQPEGWRAEKGTLAPIPDSLEQDYHALVLALRDYMHKAGFEKVLLGLSGGLDSAIVAVIAADALGAGNLRCVMMASPFTSQASLDDAQSMVDALGCRYDSLPISDAFATINATLAPVFDGLEPDVTEENIQARLRGLLLMALSNKFGEMLLTTGNKSEAAVGYTTLYGDTNGGYNPLKDLYKSRIFELCRWRNANHRTWMQGPAGEVIAPRIIDKPPSAELREGQQDSDSLPAYPVLDGILEILLEEDGSIADCVSAGYERAEAERVERLIYNNEYKRFQTAPGTRLSKRPFWLGRRYPITNRWRDGSAG